LHEFDDIRLEAYENSMFFKDKTKRFHDSSIVRKEFVGCQQPYFGGYCYGGDFPT